MTNFRLADFIVLLFFAFVAASCGNKNRLDVDVSQVDVTLKVHRIDSLLLQTPYDSIESEVTEWLADYPDFMQLYGEKIIEAGKVHTAEFPIGIKAFYNYIVAGGIDTELSEVFPDLHETEQHLQEAFRHYKYHFPNAYIPQIYTYVSGVRQSVFIADGMLGISLDKYLGQQAETYARMQIERYLRKKMYKEKIAADCMQAIAVGNFAFNDSVNNLLTNMIHQGKIMYFVDAMLPQAPDSVKIGYTAHGVRWAAHNEKEVWDYLIAKKLLFSTDPMEIRKFIGDGPFTVPFSNNSPPQIAVWTGWQIVRSYMNNNPQVSLKDLMLDTDYQRILRYSKYKP